MVHYTYGMRKAEHRLDGPMSLQGITSHETVAKHETYKTHESHVQVAQIIYKETQQHLVGVKRNNIEKIKR